MARRFTKPLPGTPLRYDHPLVNQLSAAWMMQENSGGASPEILTGRSTQLLGSTRSRWEGYARGTALTFDGASSYLGGIGNFSRCDLGLRSASFTALVSAGSRSSSCTIIEKSLYNVGNGRWAIYLNSGRLELFVCHGADLDATVGTTDIRNTGWHTIGITVVRNGSAFAYIDGKLDGLVDVSSVFNASNDFICPYHVLIGAYGDTNGLGLPHATFGYFQGSIAYVRQYRRALSSAEHLWTHEDPWDIFAAPQPLRRYFVPSSGFQVAWAANANLVIGGW